MPFVCVRIYPGNRGHLSIHTRDFKIGKMLHGQWRNRESNRGQWGNPENNYREATKTLDRRDRGRGGVTGPWAETNSLAGLFMERWSCCWSCCPRQKRGMKTAGLSLLPLSNLPPGLPLAIFSWKTAEVGAEKGSLQGSATANTEWSREEEKTYLRASYPGEAKHSSSSPSLLIKVRSP